MLTTNYVSASFADKNVSTNKTVTVMGISIGGTDAGNYTFNNSTTQLSVGGGENEAVVAGPVDLTGAFVLGFRS